MAIIPERLRPNLKLYKYAGTDKSFVSRYILAPYWAGLVELVPMWMAPNLVTLLGFAFILVNVLLTVVLSPDLVTPLPSSCYYLFGIGLFLYQSLDAIDGKQARRTGQSGPLGELFDHGCDALNTSLTVITLAPALGFGQSWWMLVSLFCTLGNFYLTTWEEYHTGVLYLGWFSGPVEGILTVVLVFFITGYMGPGVWQTPIPFMPFTFFEGAMYFGIGLIGVNVFNSVWNVWRCAQTRGASPMAAVSGLFPFVFGSMLVYLWADRTAQNMVENDLLPLTLHVCFSFGHMVGEIILAHVVKNYFPYWNVNFLPSLLALANIATMNHSGLRLIPEWLDGSNYVWVCALFSAAMYFRFALLVIHDICAELDIWCLTIKHPQGQKKLR